jgi:hypothetical protein
MTPEEVGELRRLISEFRNELSGLGVQVAAVTKRVDALAKDVADVKERLDKMIQFNGDVFFGFRSSRSSYGFADYSGALVGRNPDLFTNVISPNDFHLEIKAKLSGGVTFDGDLVASNYLSYRGGSLAASGATPGGFPGGVVAAGTNTALSETTTLYKAALNVPLSFGSNTVLTIGRYENALTPLTYMRPNYDAYFDLPWYDNGQYVSDGFKITSKFGSATTTLFGSSYTSTVGNSVGSALESPLIGSAVGYGTYRRPLVPIYGPVGVAVPGDLVASQGAGLHVGVPVGKIGEVGVTLMDISGTTSSVIAQGTPYKDVVVYGANFKLNPYGRFRVDGEAAKSVTQAGVVQSVPGLSNDDNNAYRVNATWSSGGIDAGLGWNYIDPRFSAPGDWLKIGNWYNPTNVEGPYARVGYNFTPKLRADFSGDYLVGARNRTASGDLGYGDRIARGKLGVSYKINKTFSVSGDYEGVFWNLDNGPGTSPGVYAQPIEQYITVGAGINLSGNTVLKLAYQIISATDPHGLGFGTGPGGGTSLNANVFTTQVAVHF